MKFAKVNTDKFHRGEMYLSQQYSFSSGQLFIGTFILTALILDMVYLIL